MNENENEEDILRPTDSEGEDDYMDIESPKSSNNQNEEQQPSTSSVVQVPQNQTSIESIINNHRNPELSAISSFMENGWSRTPDSEVFRVLQIVEEEMLSGNFELSAFSSIINSLLKTNSSTIKSTLWNYNRELLITSLLKFLKLPSSIRNQVRCIEYSEVTENHLIKMHDHLMKGTPLNLPEIPHPEMTARASNQANRILNLKTLLISKQNDTVL